MDRIIDLDAVAGELQARRAGWAARGLTTEDLTWRDGQAKWPQPLLTDRRAVGDPESVGLTFRRAGEDVARLVLWRGGWADLAALVDGELVVETPQFADVASCTRVADQLAEQLLTARECKRYPEPGG